MHVIHFDFSKRREYMGKINNAIYEIQRLDTIAGRNQWVNEIHPLVKLILTFFYIMVVVSFHKYHLSGLLGLAIYPVIMFIVSELSFRDSIKRLRIVLPLACFVGILNPFFDRQVMLQIGTLQVTAGMVSMLTLMIKGILSILAAYLLIATTSIEKICYAMRLLRIPTVMVTQVLLMYRYVTLLLTEANHMFQSYSLRAPNQRGIHFKVWGSLLGQLLLRSMDRAGMIYESMCLRGYEGEFYMGKKEPCQRKDYLYLLIWAVIFIVLRWIPVVTVVGNFFI